MAFALVFALSALWTAFHPDAPAEDSIPSAVYRIDCDHAKGSSWCTPVPVSFFGGSEVRPSPINPLR